jgi:hypothetical protein
MSLVVLLLMLAETCRNGPEEFDLSEQYIGWPE